MSTLQYGTVLIDLIRTGELRRELVTDGADRVVTRWTLSVFGWWNPSSNAYALPGGKAPDPFSQPGTSAALTDRVLKDYLLTPRRTLVYTVGSDIVLQAPLLKADGTRYSTDASNGPTPLACNVQGVRGAKTFLVSLTVQVDVCEDEFFLATGLPSAMLSHRWTINSDLDSCFFETRTIRGHARFRTDLLIDRAFVPDDFRNYIGQPIENGFQREAVHVELDEDGEGIEYVVVDKQKALSIVTGQGVARIEATQAVNIYQPGAFGPLFGGVRALTESRGNLSVADAGAFAVAALPRCEVEVVCKVWGQPDSQRKDLEAVAMKVVTSRLASSDVTVAGSARQISLFHDLAGRYVEVRAEVATMNWGAFVDVSIGKMPDPTSFFPDDDDTDGVLEAGQPCPFPPNDAGMRGTSLLSLAHAALKAPQGTPTKGNAVLAVDRKQATP